MHTVLTIAGTRPREHRRAVGGWRGMNQGRPRNRTGNSRQDELRTGWKARTVRSSTNSARATANTAGAKEVDRRRRRKKPAPNARNAAQSRGVLSHANVITATRNAG